MDLITLLGKQLALTALQVTLFKMERVLLHLNNLIPNDNVTGMTAKSTKEYYPSYLIRCLNNRVISSRMLTSAFVKY